MPLVISETYTAKHSSEVGKAYPPPPEDYQVNKKLADKNTISRI